MCHSLSLEEELARASLAAQDQHERVSIVVQCESTAVGPAMAHGPEHGLATELVEAVPGIDLEGFRRFHVVILYLGLSRQLTRHLCIVGIVEDVISALCALVALRSWWLREKRVLKLCSGTIDPRSSYTQA